MADYVHVATNVAPQPVFRHELFPGVDVFSNLHGRFLLERGGGPLAEKIKAVFADPDRTIRDIAYDLEFSDEFNFSRFVKRLCGLPPSQLRAGRCRPLLVGK